MAGKLWRTKRYLIVPDLHVPYHCIQFIRLVTTLIKILKPNGLIQLGDALDFWQVSSYDKNPLRKRSMMDDVKMYSTILDEWEAALLKGSKDAEIIQLEGNHEDRLRRFIWKHAKELADGWVRTVPEMLSFKSREIKCSWHEIANYQSCKIGDCILHHGHYFNAHTAVGNLTRYPKSIITGHTHRYQMASNGEKFSATLGHGSNEDDTAHQPTPTGWQQALGLLTVVNGKSALEPILVKDGACILHGKRISV